MNIYDYKVEKPNDKYLELKELQGKVILIVNTATGCGFTPQYKELEEMYEKFNQFAGQTPGTDEEIHEFCALKYNTKFEQMKKSDVNGENAIELFKYLKSQKGFEGFGNSPKALAMSVMLKSIDKDYKNNPEIKWNFTKFLVDRTGTVVERFEPTHNMKDVMTKVEKLIEGE